MAPAGDGFEVFLKYLPPSADEQGIRALFKDCGEFIGDVRILRDSKSGRCKGVAWITFAELAGAKAAMNKDGVEYDQRHVQVTMAKKVTWSGGHAASVGGIAGTLQEGGTHTPAMAKEVVASVVASDREGIFVDGTFGRGGHSRLILNALGPKGSLHAFDLDPEAVKVGRELQKQDKRFKIHHGGFKDMASVLPASGVEAGSVSGVFLDLGISSPQLDEAARGFRPEQSGPLDLRFDLTKGLSAADLLRDASREELLRVLREYGDPSDPHAARRVVDAICLARAGAAPGGRGLPKTTKEFSDLVASCRGYEYQAMHAAKATFQALRIHLNDEFGQLRGGSAAALEVLKPEGRLGVLTWKHSECALLVDFLRKVEVAPSNFPLLLWHQAGAKAGRGGSSAGAVDATAAERAARRLAKQRWGFVAEAAQRPTSEELRLNSRSRSAVLHILRKRRGSLCSDLEALAAATFGWSAATASSSSASSGAVAGEAAAEGAAAGEVAKKRKRKESVEVEKEEHGEEEEEVAGAKKKKRSKEQAPSSSALSSAGIELLFDDDVLMAISKPAGMLCHPSPGFWDHGTVMHALEGVLPKKMLKHRESYTGEADSFIPRAMVHRLDKGTTGVLLLAKTPGAEEHLTQQFKGRSMKKRYVALLLGSHPGGEEERRRIVVEQPIGRDPSRPGKMLVAADGKAAKSIVSVHAHDPEHGLSLVTVELLTGRQHQIRVHCAHLGAPVAGDGDYGAKPKALAKLRRAAGAEDGAGAPRPLLHCWEMRLAHPGTEELLTVQAPVPPDIRSIITHVWPALSEDPAKWPSTSASSAPAPSASARASSSSTSSFAVRLRGLPFGCAPSDVVAFLARRVDIEEDQVRVASKNKKPKTLKPGDLRPGEAEVILEATEDLAERVRALNNEHLGGRYIEVTVTPAEAS